MFMVNSNKGRSALGVILSTAHAAGFSNLLILEIGSGTNDSNVASMMLLVMLKKL